MILQLVDVFKCSVDTAIVVFIRREEEESVEYKAYSVLWKPVDGLQGLRTKILEAFQAETQYWSRIEEIKETIRNAFEQFSE